MAEEKLGGAFFSVQEPRIRAFGRNRGYYSGRWRRCLLPALVGLSHVGGWMGGSLQEWHRLQRAVWLWSVWSGGEFVCFVRQ